MPQCSQVSDCSLTGIPECAITKFVSSSLIGMWLLTGTPSAAAAHCSHRCRSIPLPPLISVRCTVAALLQLSHVMVACLARTRQEGSDADESYFPEIAASNAINERTVASWC